MTFDIGIHDFDYVFGVLLGVLFVMGAVEVFMFLSPWSHR